MVCFASCRDRRPHEGPASAALRFSQQRSSQGESPPDEAFGLIHGKAGVITRTDGSRVCFIGSANESRTAWVSNYELVWLDESEEVTVAAPRSGLYVRSPGLFTSDPVEAGDLLGHILGLSDLETTEVRAPVTGYLYSFTGNLEDRKPVPRHPDHPFVEAGEPVAQIIRP